MSINKRRTLTPSRLIKNTRSERTKKKISVGCVFSRVNGTRFFIIYFITFFYLYCFISRPFPSSLRARVTRGAGVCNDTRVRLYREGPVTGERREAKIKTRNGRAHPSTHRSRGFILREPFRHPL